jgi:hypothetical protein
VAKGEPLSVIYPNSSGRDKEHSYDYQLLRLALEKSGVEFDLSLTTAEMNEARARRMIAQNDPEVTVMSGGTSEAFEEQLAAVYVPIYGGLIGHRLFIIHKDNLEQYAQIRTLEDLQPYLAGQGHNWPDITVFKDAKLPVVASEYPILFKLAEYKRIDYFPRGANEAFLELERFNTDYPSLVVEPTLMLVYPYALYFFVSHDNTKLHDAILRGLKAAHEDGSFVEFFRSHPTTRKMLQAAQLDDRNRIDINNPTMSNATLSIPDPYWFHTSWQP